MLEDIDKFYEPAIARNIKFLLTDIDGTKHRVDRQRDRVWWARQIAEVTLIILGAVSTAMVAVGNRMPHVAPWVVVPTTMVTILSGINAFYDYGGEHARLTQLRSSLSQIQGRVIFDVNLDLATNKDKIIAQKIPEEYLRTVYNDIDIILNRHVQEQLVRLPPTTPPPVQDVQ
jgi:hypothetical protein